MSTFRGFAVVDDCLQLGGQPLTRLADRLGGTPFYAYDRRLIDARIAALRGALPAAVRLHYAIKANPMPAVVQHLRGLVDGFDLASAGEMHVALDAGMPAELISFAGPGKADRELASAAAAGVTVNLESAGEMRRLADIGKSLGYRPRVAVRVNPDFELKSSGMKMGGGPKQFGIDAEIVPETLDEMRGLDLDFLGFHIYSGSQNLRPEAIAEAQEKTLALALRLAEHAPAPVRKLNIGGGFGIPYFPGDEPLDLGAVGATLGTLLERFAPQLGEQAEVIIELGRYIVGEAGVYVSRVVDKKTSRGQTFLVTDGGLHHHLAASGNFGQVIRKNYPAVVGNKVNEGGDADDKATAVGPLCTPLDLMANKMPIGHAEIGDLIVIFQSGAYGLTASPLGFLSHPEPMEVLV